MEPVSSYCLHKRIPSVRILIPTNLAHNSRPISLKSILILSSHLRLGLPSECLCMKNMFTVFFTLFRIRVTTVEVPWNWTGNPFHILIPTHHFCFRAFTSSSPFSHISFPYLVTKNTYETHKPCYALRYIIRTSKTYLTAAALVK
jgi:hypothetical protein